MQSFSIILFKENAPYQHIVKCREVRVFDTDIFCYGDGGAVVARFDLSDVSDVLINGIWFLGGANK